MADTKTQEQLAIQVLDNLTVTEANETPSAEDVEKVLDHYGPVWEMLSTERLVVWGKDEDIPEHVFLPLAQIVSSWVAPAFGVRYDEAAEGMFMLRRQIALARPYVPVRFQNF